MAVYRQIHTSFWQDPEIIEYEPEEKYFYLYLMTNPHTTQCGIYEVSPRLISVELGYPMDRVWELLKIFIDRGKILYSKDTREIFLLNWLKYNSLKSPKVMACVEKELAEVKFKPFLKKFYDLCIQYKYPIDRLSIDLGEEKEEEKEKEKEKEQKQEKEDSSGSSYPQEPVDNLQDENLAAIAKEFEKNGFGTINATVRDILIDFLDKYSVEWIVQAMKVAVKANKRTLSYVEGILKNWNANGGMQLESPQTNIAPKIKKNKFHNFEQRTDKYTADQLEEIARKKREEYYKKVVLGGNQDDK